MTEWTKCRGSIASIAAGTLCCLLQVGPVEAQTLFTDVTESSLPQLAQPPGQPPQYTFDDMGEIVEFTGPFERSDARNVVFVDYDNDGFQDVFITENPIPDAGPPTFPRRIGLFHNTGDGRFVDQSWRIPMEFHVGDALAGAVFGDYDNDGDEDLFLPIWPQEGLQLIDPSLAHSVLLRNDRGRFVEVDAGSDLALPLLIDGAIWLDYDADGHLDLYVSNCPCGPPGFAAGPNRLLRNLGDGTFSDQTAEAGLDAAVGVFGFGTGGGMIAADFNDDGGSDLYLGFTAFQTPDGLVENPNRLLLNDGGGRFVDATTVSIADPGVALTALAGDIDNDGDLDIFQASAISSEVATYASLLLLNLGDGEFINATEGAGLGLDVLQQVPAASFLDVDNDGDLDLVIPTDITASGFENHLFLNDGRGLFVQTSASGLKLGSYVATADVDEDGFVDLVDGALPRGITALYHNNGNSNHWLRVELVGTQSNRGAIGARLTATSGNLSQIREVLGGVGRQQDERVATFGLGESVQVDTLTVRWPSGLIEVFTDIEADQKIRVIEGQGRWAPAQPTVWETPPPARLEFGAEVLLSAIVQPALFEPDATITSVTADLSHLGGPRDVPLEDLGDGRYQLVSQLTVSGERENRVVEVLILQETSLGERWTQLSHDVVVEAPITAVLERHDALVPEAFTLSQNYPNPFNPETTIRFDLPAAADVDLSLFDLAGQRVATLATGLRQAGSYHLRWDGRDDAGRALASGMYFYRLATGNQVLTRKLLLLR